MITLACFKDKFCCRILNFLKSTEGGGGVRCLMANFCIIINNRVCVFVCLFVVFDYFFLS